MSTFILPGSDSVSVTLPSDLSKDQLLQFPAFRTWLSTLQSNLRRQAASRDHEFHGHPYILRGIKVQSVDRFGGGERLGFVKLIADIKNDKNESLPGSVFLRGPSVAMMVILQPNDVEEGSETEKHVLLTLQPRIPAATLAMPELPAGMVDGGTFSGSAAKEIREELGLEIPEEQLTNLTELSILHGDEKGERIPRAVFPSAGGCDEYIPIFMHTRRVPRSQLKEWTGRLTGLRDHGEKITLKLVRLEDLWQEGARDAKALGAYALYQGLKSVGRL
ncbi:MAG: hypothetical protein M1818_003236 [Claussenomyces sp. TS43310]|nr:MAG: hypothetical protein M1818_003236 [Claussenomyces sp. TS43310]